MPREEDEILAFLSFPFFRLEESELRELKWHAQESQVQLLNLEVQKELLISLLRLHLSPSQEMAPLPSIQALRPET